MKSNRIFISTAAVAAILVSVITGQSVVKAEDEGGSMDPRIQRGFEIAPVPLNLEGKNYELVGLGSYLVNAEADCNVCHNALPGPNGQYVKGGNPYFGQPIDCLITNAIFETKKGADQIA